MWLMYLVGNEAIDQLVKFNAALADHSHQVNHLWIYTLQMKDYVID